jgi:hypothetical protein
MSQQLALSYEQLRSLVIQHLAQPTRDPRQLNDLYGGVAKLAVDQHGIIPHREGQTGIIQLMHGSGVRLTEKDCGRVASIIWDLIIEGVVRPGKENGGDAQLPFFYVTDFGKERIKDPLTPYDPDGYLKATRRDVSGVDDVIMTYLAESLHTFRIGSLLSSTITLGCASEKALLLLIGAYGDALQSPRQEKFRKNTEGLVIKRQFDEFNKMLDSHLKGLLPADLKENLDVALLAVFALLRTNRNEAGHPTGKTVQREQAYASLTVFPTYLKKVYELIAWLKANAPLT